MTDHDLLTRITELVDREHQLRSKAAQGALDHETERAQLAELEVQLDQCWDLLRQRRARREFGQDTAEAQVRPVSEVEGYRQ